jgi:thiamine-phosphate diphosphorylase
MSRSNGLRFFVLEAPRGVPCEWSLAQALAHAGRAAQTPRPMPAELPELTAALRARGAAAVWVADPDAAPGQPGHWLDTEHARGWVSADPALAIETLLAGWQAGLTQGHVPVDAALLVWPEVPSLSWGDQPGPANEALPLAVSAVNEVLPLATTPADKAPPSQAAPADTPLGLYAIVDTAPALRRVLEAGVRTVQLRMKRPADADAAWVAALRTAVRDSLSAARDHGARLFVNDHWRLAAELGAEAVHLGQEDLLALGEDGRAELRATGLGLGVSSHAVWELCRARGLSPSYVACGPVWPTITKDMPWRPQGLDNLAWWCRVAGAPVVAIGGILAPDQVRQAAAAGASGVCVLRGLGSDPHQTVGALQQAFEQGHQEALAQAGQPVARLHPTLDATR